MQISKRLKTIADLVPECGVLADIGSDHAYLPIYLVKKGMIKKAIATDVNEGPVKIANQRTREYRVSDRIEVRKGDGLEPINPGEADIIVIAGMGGLLIEKILEARADVARSGKLLILQPMRDADYLRKWLLANSYEIMNEELVEDEGKIYEIEVVKPSGKKQEGNERLLIGPKIIEKKHPLTKELIRRRIRELDNIIKALEDKPSENSKERKAECEDVLKYYKEVLEWVQ